ncbi:hypothetical protein AAHC03_018913 [Spirometra sp. Aus1]
MADNSHAYKAALELENRAALFEHALLQFANAFEGNTVPLLLPSVSFPVEWSSSPEDSPDPNFQSSTPRLLPGLQDDIPCVKTLIAQISALRRGLSTYLKSSHSNEFSGGDCPPLRPTQPVNWSRSRGCCFPGCGSGVGMVSCGLCCRNKLSTVSEDEPCVECASIPCTCPVVTQVADNRLLMNQPAVHSRRQFRPPSAPSEERPANNSPRPRCPVDAVDAAVMPSPPPADPFASFVADLESAMAHCDVDNPGSRTGAPPSPNLASIRRSHEACLPVWKEFFQSRNQPLSAELREDLTKSTFNNWPWSDAQLLCFVRHFFVGEGESDERLHLTQACGVPLDTLDTWLCAVYSYYNSVPFHNFKHAFMVTQMMYASIWQAHLTSIFSHLDLLVLIFSALCHDVDHRNNVQSRLSICYNTNSPLENHHCAVAFDLVRTPETNIFKGLSDADANLAKLLSLRCILGTDMGKHTEILQAWTAKLVALGLPTTTSSSPSDCAAVLPSSSASENQTMGVDATAAGCSRPPPTCAELTKIFAEDEEARALTMVMLLKMCDISTEIRPPVVSQPWLDCLLEEFYAQADIEKLTGLPVSPFMDRASVRVAECQCAFLKFGMLPLAELIVAVFPDLGPIVLVPAREQFEFYSKQAEAIAAPPNDPKDTEPAPDTADEQVEASKNSHRACDSQSSTADTCPSTDFDGTSDKLPEFSSSHPASNLPPPVKKGDHNEHHPDVMTEAGEKEDGNRTSQEPPFSTALTSDLLSHPPAMHSPASPIPKWVGATAHCQATPPSRLTDTTLVSSAGVSEFCPHHPQLLQPSDHVPLRFLRRSLGELPWPRNLHSDFADILAENRYLSPPSYLWPRHCVASPDSDLATTATGRSVAAGGATINGHPPPPSSSCNLPTVMSLRNSGMRSLSTTAAINKTELLLPPRQPPPSQQQVSPSTSTDPTASEVCTPPPVRSLTSPANQDAAALSKRKCSTSTALTAHI